jgi:Na+-transporting methylmalonyl-CoA/oxaloacetate decarboxylase gamma subunit
MEDTMYLGSMLMAVGMTTVFTILALVVLAGKLTISITNKFAPSTGSAVVQRSSGASTNASKIAAITAVVESVTQGKGHIIEIKKS